MAKPEVSTKSRIIKGIVLLALIAVVVVAVFIVINRSRKGINTEDTESSGNVSRLIMRDLEHNYPPSPREVVKYYSDITMVLYAETYSEDELRSLASQMLALYDDDLAAQNPYDEYLDRLAGVVTDYKTLKKYVDSYDIQASTDIEEFTQDGYTCARVFVTYSVTDDAKGTKTPVQEAFILRRDESKHWRIFGFDLADKAQKLVTPQ